MSESVTRRAMNHPVWIGAALSLVALLSYFTLFVRFPDLRDTAWVNLIMMAAGVGVSAWGLARRRSLWSVAGLAFSTLCALALTGYVFGLSYQLPNDAGVVAIGEQAPRFELSDHEGRIVDLGDFSGSTVVLVFYRGFW